MSYRITGLPVDRFAALFGASDSDLDQRGARRIRAESSVGYPCRVTLEDVPQGEALILLNHVSNDVSSPYRASFAIFVREHAPATAIFTDEIPPMLGRRALGLRGYDEEGTLRRALLALPGEADAGIRQLLSDEQVHEVHAHNAAHGCFLARVERD